MSPAVKPQRTPEREAWIAEQLARAPRLTDAQRHRIGLLLRGGDAR